MSNDDLQSILARHNLRGINVANFSQPRSHQSAPSRPQPYQYPAPAPQPQQVYQYPAVARQQWSPPAEPARQQVRPSFAWPSAPQPQYTIDPRHYSYNIWGKVPVYSLTGEDEDEKDEEDGDEKDGDEEEGEDAAPDADGDAGVKAEESIEAVTAATEDTVSEEKPTEEAPPTASEDAMSSTTPEGAAATGSAKDEIAPEPSSEEPPSESTQPEIQPAIAEEPPAAPSSEEETAASKDTSQESDSVPEASQEPSPPGSAEEEAPVSESVAVTPAVSESPEPPAVEEIIGAVDASATEEKAPEDQDSHEVYEEGAAEASESMVEDALPETPPAEDSPADDAPTDNSPSQDSPPADPPSLDAPDRDTGDENPASVEPSSADQNPGPISEPEPQVEVGPAPEPDSVVVEEPAVEQIEQQPSATEPGEEPTEIVQVIDSTNTNDEPAAIIIDVGGDETTAEDTVVVIDVPLNTSNEVFDVPPPPPPVPHVTIAEPIKPPKVSSSKMKSSRSSKSRQPGKPREVKPVEIIPLKEGKHKATSKTKSNSKQVKGKAVEKAMKVFVDIPPPPPLVVAVLRDEIIDVPPPVPSPPPVDDVIEVAETADYQVIDVVDEKKDSEEAAAKVETPSPMVEVIASSADEEAAAAERGQEDHVVEDTASSPSGVEPTSEPVSELTTEATSEQEQQNSIVAECPEPAKEAAVSAESPAKDLPATTESSKDTAAEGASAEDAGEVMPPPPQSDDTSLAASGSEVIADEPRASVQEVVVSVDPSVEPATVEENAYEAPEHASPAEVVEENSIETIEKAADVSSAPGTAVLRDEPVAKTPELVAESAPTLMELIVHVIPTGTSSEHKDEAVEESQTNKSETENIAVDAGANLEDAAPADDIPEIEPDIDHADDGVVAIIAHPEEEESIDADVDILPEAPMPPGTYMSDAEGESGGEDEEGGQQHQEMDGETTTEPIEQDGPTEGSDLPEAVAVEKVATDLPNSVEENLMTAPDSDDTAKGSDEAAKTEASDHVRLDNTTPDKEEGATSVSPVETPDFAVDIPPADQDALSPPATQEQEAEAASESAHQPDADLTGPVEHALEDSKVEEDPVLVETPAAPESKATEASPPAEELGGTESSETIDTHQAPPDQKPEDEATAQVGQCVLPDIVKEAADEGKTQETTEPVAARESGEATGAIGDPASTDEEAGASEQLPTKHETEAVEDSIKPVADEVVVEKPAAEEPATEEFVVQDPEPVVEKTAADTIEEPVMPEPAAVDSGDHEHALTEASEPVADDSAHTEPCETTTDQNVISDQEASAGDNRPEQVAQTTTNYIPEQSADILVKDINEANDAASSTSGTMGQEEGGTISNKPSLQTLVEDVQGRSAKELLEGRTAPSLSDHGDQDIPDSVPTDPIVEKSLEPDEEPSPRLPSISASEEEVQESATSRPAVPKHAFAEAEEDFGPQDSSSQRGQPVGIPPLESVYTEHQFDAEMSGAFPPESAAPSGSNHHPPSRASAREPPAASRASKQSSRASPPKEKRRSSHGNVTTRTKVKDMSRPTGDAKAPVEIHRRTTTKTTPPAKIFGGFGIKSSNSRSSRQPSEADELKRKADELDARQRQLDRELEEARQRATIAEKAKKLREQEAELAALHEAERAAKREERRQREQARREAEHLRDEEAKPESSREPERPAHRHRRRHTDRVSEPHRRHRDERPHTRKHSSSYHDEQVREQSPVLQPREPRVRRYRTEEIGSERRRTEEVNREDEVYMREEPIVPRHPEERRRRSRRESRKEEKPKGLFESLKNVFKKL